MKHRCTAIVPSKTGRAKSCGKAAHGPFCADHDAMFVTMLERATGKAAQR